MNRPFLPATHLPLRPPRASESLFQWLYREWREAILEVRARVAQLSFRVFREMRSPAVYPLTRPYFLTSVVKIETRTPVHAADQSLLFRRAHV